MKSECVCYTREMVSGHFNILLDENVHIFCFRCEYNYPAKAVEEFVGNARLFGTCLLGLLGSDRGHQTGCRQRTAPAPPVPPGGGHAARPQGGSSSLKWDRAAYAVS